jgi:hypothetical protein
MIGIARRDVNDQSSCRPSRRIPRPVRRRADGADENKPVYLRPAALVAGLFALDVRDAPSPLAG